MLMENLKGYMPDSSELQGKNIEYSVLSITNKNLPSSSPILTDATFCVDDKLDLAEITLLRELDWRELSRLDDSDPGVPGVGGTGRPAC